ncbi:MAG TPA: TIGR03086 family metal-binding protein [Actinopolymorphaceae bacterium]
MHTNSRPAEPDLVLLDAHAVRVGLDLLTKATPDDLTKPTPCAAWTLYGLLAHMATQNHGFAAAARGEASPDHWKPLPLGDRPFDAYRESAEAVLAAFAADDALERSFLLHEFSADHRFPAEQAIGFHLVDYVVHAWDVARTLGLTVEFDPDIVAVAHGIVEGVPAEARLAPGAAFGPEVPWSGGTPLDRLVAFLGRSPSWPDRKH